MSHQEDALARRIAIKMRASEGLATLFGVVMEDARRGWAQCSMTVTKEMTNGHGFCHGGAIFSIADNAFAWACNSRNVAAMAQSATISFISPAKVGEKLIATAHEEASEGRTGIYTVKVTADDGRTIAIFQGLSRTAGGKVVEE